MYMAAAAALANRTQQSHNTQSGGGNGNGSGGAIGTDHPTSITCGSSNAPQVGARPSNAHVAQNLHAAHAQPVMMNGRTAYIPAGEIRAVAAFGFGC